MNPTRSYLATLASIALALAAGADCARATNARHDPDGTATRAETTSPPPPVSSGSGEEAAEPELREVNGRVDVVSEYSHIVIGERGTVRSLSFVRDSGEVVLESEVDVARPHDLLVEYTRSMFASYFFRPEPTRVALIGLGGGAMVHFLEHYDSDVVVDAIDIDPEIVRIADEYFGVRDTDTVNILTEDGFVFLEETTNTYDVIFMDAFLKPSEDTDSTGVPLRLKTIAFFEQMQTHLAEGGVVVFNLNTSAETVDDIDTIHEAFANSYVFRVPHSGNFVVVGSTDLARVTDAELVRRGVELDARLAPTFSFEEMARQVRPE